MKKSLIALAVAGAFAAPAFAATSNVDVYGVLNVYVQSTDAGDDDMGVVDNASRIGFKGSEDLGGGLKAIWQIESGLTTVPAGATAAGTGVGTSDIAGRNTFIGLSGGFGTVLMGRHDTPYKMSTGSMDLFGDTIGDYEDNNLGVGAGLNDAHDARVANAVAYVSPDFNGFGFAAAVVLDENADDETTDAISLAAHYKNGPLLVAFGYQDAKPQTVNTLGGATQDSDIWKLGVSYTMGDLTMNAIYEDGEVDTVGDVSNWVIGAKYSMGAIALKAQYADSEFDAVGAGGKVDSDMWAIGVDYALSKRTTAFFVYADGDADGGVENDGWNIGMKHSF